MPDRSGASARLAAPRCVPPTLPFGGPPQRTTPLWREVRTNAFSQMHLAFGVNSTDRVRRWKKENPEAAKLHRERATARMRAWREANREQVAQREKEYRERNVDRIRETGRKWVSQNREKVRAAKRLVRYGLTADEFNTLLHAQEGLCAVCREPLILEKRNGCHVDHCHQTMRVRGLLCGSCNGAIGRLGDNAEGLRRALAYLERFEAS